MNIVKVTTDQQLKDACNELAFKNVLALDTETTGLQWWKSRVFLIQIYDGENCYLIDPAKLSSKFMPYLQIVFCRPHHLTIGHNIKFDMHQLKQSFNIDIRTKIFDTKVAAHLLNENRNNSLKPLMLSVLKREPLEEGQINDWFKQKKILNKDRNYSFLPKSIIAPYAIQDAVCTFKLYEKFAPLMDKHFRSLFQTEMAIIKILFKMEQSGVQVDVSYLEGLQKIYEVNIIKQRDLLYQWFPDRKVNFDSPKQLAKLLYKNLDLPILKKSSKTGEPSTDVTVLKQLKHPFVADLLHYRKLQKIHSTYIQGLLTAQHEGIIHANYNQTGTETGRFSCSKPNLQNLSKQDDIKRAFLVDPECEMWWADQSQIEMVGFTHYSKEQKMMDMIIRGEDIYKGAAQQVLHKSDISKQERQVFKNMCLAMIYGVGQKKLALFLNNNLEQDITQKEALAFRNGFLDEFPGVKNFMLRVSNTVKNYRHPWGHYVQNQFGRVRRVEIQKVYTAVNHLIQGWAADLMKRAMVRIENDLHPNWKMQLHDAIRIDIPLDMVHKKEYTNEVAKCLTDFPEVSVPIRVKMESSKTNWAECVKYG